MRKIILFVLLLTVIACETNEEDRITYLDDIAATEYYSKDIIPSSYGDIYGMWNLYSTSGGITGGGYEPGFDHLEIKKYGIYGIVSSGRLIDHGMIKVEETDENAITGLKLSFVSMSDNESVFDVTVYADVSHTDTLNLIAPCCDRYNFHFVKMH